MHTRFLFNIANKKLVCDVFLKSIVFFLHPPNYYLHVDYIETIVIINCCIIVYSSATSTTNPTRTTIL
jgi:hypothetical protein